MPARSSPHVIPRVPTGLVLCGGLLEVKITSPLTLGRRSNLRNFLDMNNFEKAGYFNPSKLMVRSDLLRRKALGKVFLGYEGRRLGHFGDEANLSEDE